MKVKRSTNRNRYERKITVQQKNRYLDLLINPSFQEVNRPFAYHIKMLVEEQITVESSTFRNKGL